MGLSILRKQICYIIIILLVLPTFSAFAEGMKPNKNNFINPDDLSFEVTELLKNYSEDELDKSLDDYLVRFNEKMHLYSYIGYGI